MGIEKNSHYAMFNYGRYFEDIKDYKNMVKYYKMAIENDTKNNLNRIDKKTHCSFWLVHKIVNLLKNNLC
jgi:hypothetical protein